MYPILILLAITVFIAIDRMLYVQKSKVDVDKLMSLLKSQNGSNMRSQSWNSAMPVVEAGIEEALAHLNSTGLGNGNLATQGWTQSGDWQQYTRAETALVWLIVAIRATPHIHACV